MTDSDQSLTQREMFVVKKTVKGVTELLNNIMSKHTAKEWAKILSSPQRQSTKSIGATAVLYGVTIGNQKLPARREPIREKLPANLVEIDKSDLSDILQGFVRMHLLKNMTKPIRLPRDRPAGLGFKDSNRGGRPSSYRKTEELEKVIKVLTKPEAMKLINTKLKDIGLLYTSRKYYNLVLYYMIRNHDKEALWDNVKPFGIEESINNIANEKERAKKREASEVFLQRIRNISEEDLEHQADITAKEYITKHADDKDLFIDIIGGLLGYTNIKD